MLKMQTINAGDIVGLEGVARLAAETHGFSDAAELELFTLTENATYRVSEAGRTPIVLRVYRPASRPAIEIQSELAWMRALRTDLGPVVPNILAGLDGSQLVEVIPSSGTPTCFCVAMSLAPGSEPREDELATWFPRLGEITARFHQHARGWTPPNWFSRPTWDVATSLGDRPHWGHWYASVPDPEERTQLQRLADVVAARLERFGASPARFGLVHADLRIANLVADGDAIQAIDFDDCGFSWYLYDLACALTFLEARDDADDLIASWVDGYRKIASMPADDEAEIPTLLMLRRLLISSYVGLRPDIGMAHELAANGYNAETCTLAETYLGRFDTNRGDR